MGAAKNFQMECEDRGFWPIDTKSVCAKCIQDSFLETVVNDHLDSAGCSYCDNYSDDDDIATSLEILMEHIVASIRNEYSEVQECMMPWVEGKYLIDPVPSEEVLEDFDPGWPEELSKDIAAALNINDWVPTVQGSWAGSDQTTILAYGWERFKEQVMERTRYLFLSIEHEDNVYDEDDIPISKMLETLGILANRLNLVKSLQPHEVLYRVRVTDKKIEKFSDIGPPPVGKAGAGRMNPAGIPYFYLAFDEETAILETISKCNTVFSLGRFSTIAELKILDLTDLPNLPSRLNASQYDYRCALKFLYEFVDDISEPIEKDERVHIDYVPTQVVSEFFRYGFKDKQGNAIHGLKYPSCQNDGGYNIVLFVPESKDAKRFLKYEAAKQYKTTSIEKEVRYKPHQVV